MNGNVVSKVEEKRRGVSEELWGLYPIELEPPKERPWPEFLHVQTPPSQGHIGPFDVGNGEVET
jgi:hypothetical protein